MKYSGFRRHVTILIMISNASYIQKPNKSQEVVREESGKMVAQFPAGVVHYFG
jgi:hypothetical protein